MVSSKRARHATRAEHELSDTQAQALAHDAEDTGGSVQKGHSGRSARPEVGDRCFTHCECVESIFDLGGPFPYVQIRGLALHDANALQDVDDVVEAALLDPLKEKQASSLNGLLLASLEAELECTGQSEHVSKMLPCFHQMLLVWVLAVIRFAAFLPGRSYSLNHYARSLRKPPWRT
jgi:hypothetical protein